MRRERASRPASSLPAGILTSTRGGVRQLSSAVAWALILGIALQSSVALADAAAQKGAAPVQTEKAPAEVAKEHFESALEAYREGKYERAVEELEEALRLDPSGKDLVYNLGLVHEKLGNLDKALFYFRRYLEMETDPAERERAEVIVQRLAGAQERALRASSGGDDDPNQPGSGQHGQRGTAQDRSGGKLDVWVYGTAGLSLAALTLGVVFGVRALLTHPGGSPTTGPGESAGDLQHDASSAHDMALVADISFGVALLSGAAASLLYFGRSADEPAGQSASRVGLDPVPYGINYRGTF
ncbi:MAG: tetratricopeptide repeat protein [Polyangiaceae bacterium]|nr:tetratricopeptide repeat protein [Polyangiaceae bacterium]MCB9608416.1 tetratricopeptide repeat protein [Polyangiaceae bacterium]